MCKSFTFLNMGPLKFASLFLSRVKAMYVESSSPENVRLLPAARLAFISYSVTLSEITSLGIEKNSRVAL